MMRRYSRDFLILALLFLLPLVMFWSQTIGGQTLLPAENLYQYLPYAAYRAELGVPEVPHNALLSDLVLQNMQWKAFIRESLSQGEFPLWNPHQFAGIPFFAAGQQSTLYPFNVLYYVLPLHAAYGWFTVVQLWLAGAFMYLFVRGLGVGRTGGAIAGITYQLSGFFIASAVFPMIIASAAWLPLLLLMIEFVIQRRPFLRGQPATVPWVSVGVVALGCNILAGHVEITYYTLLIMAFYASARLIVIALTPQPPLPQGEGQKDSGFAAPLSQGTGVRALRFAFERGVWLLLMVALGVSLGAVQFIPLFEFASMNYRADSATLEQIRRWAHPLRDVVQFLMPNFYGNPSHHAYFDVFSGQTVSLSEMVVNNLNGSRLTTIDWGIKNYVEGALYVGILPLALAVYAVIKAFIPASTQAGSESPNKASSFAGARVYILIFALLAVLALTFMFGLPTYALLYLLPGIDQLHSPFRWVFALTLSVAVLAAFGWELLANVQRRLARVFGYGLLALGALVLVGLLLSRLFYPQIESLLDSLVQGLAEAPRAFSDARMFYSYQFTNVLILGVMLVGAGGLFVLASPRKRGLALALVAADLLIASWGFNPASDPAWLEFTPPAIEWLQAQPGEWRYTTLDDPTVAYPELMKANMGWRYGLDDIRGYESIISKQYVDYMQNLAPQVQLDFNRVAPLYTVYPESVPFDYRAALESPVLDTLNVRYIITHLTTSLEDGYTLAYEDEAVRIWERDGAMPRAYTLSEGGAFRPATITGTTGREHWIDVSVEQGDVFVFSQTHYPGWRAFIREPGAGDNAETPVEVNLYAGNIQSINLPPGDWTVRLVYSPQSFSVGVFASFIAGALLLLLFGAYLWRLVVNPQAGDVGNVRSVARNSVAPIIMNLFNRMIDFAFAFVMLRVLGPEGNGIYTYVVVIFGWFDIITNFGLNLYLTREVARDRSRAGTLFAHTSALRLLLLVAGVPLLLLFLLFRQSAVQPPLTAEALMAVGLLYIGLLPGTLNTGFAALFYAFERAEIPAVVATLATICKAAFGLAALLLGWGVVGLAAVSILTNVITLLVLGWNGRGYLGASQSRREGLQIPLLRRMTGESWPLMLNHLLATIFFQIDVIIIEAFHGERMLGQYGVAYKWVLALNIIPSFFTQAMLPVMSRQAQEDRAALKRSYLLAIKLLVSVALPVAVAFTFMAEFLTGVLGGTEFLPDGAIATQFMIWSIPIGWMNSLTQYVLIALDLQKRITRAFIAAVTFNIVTNLIFVPIYGYRAAAVTTIMSELVLFIPFALLLQSALGKLPWMMLLWRPVVAALIMLGGLAAAWSLAPLPALIGAVVLYVVVLVGLRPFTGDEVERLMPLLPSRLRRFAAVFAR
jgi:O-antigen/teichoic acid export membrane protein